jgi:Sugar phosphate isomerases/epimerases
MQFGCCIVPEQYRQAVRADFDFVELAGSALFQMSDAAFDALCTEILTGPVPALACNSYCTDRGSAIVGPHYRREEAEQYAKKLCARASRLGIKMIGIGSPQARRLPIDFDCALAEKQGREFLRVTAEAAGMYGMTVNLEQLNPFCCDYGTATADAAQTVRIAGQSNTGLVVDFYHRTAAGEETCSLVGFSDLICHTHNSSCWKNRERGYPHMEDLEEYTKIPAALQAIGYRGTMSIETQTIQLEKDGQKSHYILWLAEKKAGGEKQ